MNQQINLYKIMKKMKDNSRGLQSKVFDISAFKDDLQNTYKTKTNLT